MKCILVGLFALLAVSWASELGVGEGKLKILVNSPSLGYSHMQFHGKLADLLVERGHSVDVFIPNWTPFETRNGTEKANVIKFYASTYTRYHELDFFQNPFKNTDLQLDTDRAAPYINCTLQFCMDIVSHPTLMEEIKNKKYDLLIAEMFDPCIFYLAEVVGIKVKIVSSALSMPDEIAFLHGIPVPRSYVPSVFASSATVPELSWAERAMNMIIDVYHPMLLGQLTEQMRELYVQKFNVQIPTFHDIIRSSSYVFVNVHDHFDSPRPITRKIQYVGGIAVKKPASTQLPHIEAIFKQAPKGVILFSMGSLVDTALMPLQLKTAFIRAFARFPQYSVIWRFKPSLNDTELLAQAPNVFTVDWMDQTTILADERTKLFITHCGQNSALEAAYGGTPVLAMPLFADQNYNAALLIKRGLGLFQDVRKIEEEELVAKFDKLLNNPSYRVSGKRLSRKLQDEPFKPEERFVRLVEYAARHWHPEDTDLELHVTKLSFIVRHNLDIYIPLIASTLLLVFITYKLSKLTIRFANFVLSLNMAKQKIA